MPKALQMTQGPLQLSTGVYEYRIHHGLNLLTPQIALNTSNLSTIHLSSMVVLDSQTVGIVLSKDVSVRETILFYTIYG